MDKYILGLDIADMTKTATRAVIVDEEGTVVRRGHFTAASGPADLEELAAGCEIASVGVAIDAGGWTAVGVDLPEGLSSAGPPIICEPGTAAVTAEAWIGAARGARHVICLKIGDRVIAGILLDGTPWAGAHRRAGSAAWLALNPVERQDYRKFGSLAAEVSNKGIARRLSWRIQAGDHSAVLEKAGDLESITAAHVFDGARTGDGVSISVVRDTAKYIGMAVANLVVSIDPEIVVLSGAIASAGDLLLEPVRQECARRLPPNLADEIPIEMSPLGDDVIAIGAARMAMLATP